MDLRQLIWMIPLTLFILVLLQMLYVIWLSLSSNRRRESRRPASPIMPTSPVNYVPVGNSAPAAMPITNSSPSQPPANAYQPAPISGSSSVGGLGKFVVLSGLNGVREMSLPASQFTIGRFINNEGNILMAIDEKSISRKHANFISDESIREYYLMDMHSSYGTFILKNGQFEQLPPERQVRVYNEDVVQFGNAVRVRLVLPCETRAAMTRI